MIIMAFTATFERKRAKEGFHTKCIEDGLVWYAATNAGEEANGADYK